MPMLTIEVDLLEIYIYTLNIIYCNTHQSEFQFHSLRCTYVGYNYLSYHQTHCRPDNNYPHYHPVVGRTLAHSGNEAFNGSTVSTSTLQNSSCHICLPSPCEVFVTSKANIMAADTLATPTYSSNR